jgi:hypothetical protein
MSWSHGPGDKARRATYECILCDVGDNNIAFTALRTRGVVDYVTDVYVSTLSAITWKCKREKVTLVNSETFPRDRTLINGKDARALIDLAFVVILFFVVFGTVAISSSGF